MEIARLGPNYTTVRGLDVLGAAAANPGGGAIGAGIGIGAGLAGGAALGGLLGGAVGGGMSKGCTGCGKAIPQAARFCQFCGVIQP
jgi:hypothetical protein